MKYKTKISLKYLCFVLFLFISFKSYSQLSVNFSKSDYTINQTRAAIGKVGFTLEGNDWFSLNPDGYDFNMESNGFSQRNVLTGLDWILNHLTLNSFSQTFPIYFVNNFYIPKQ